MKRPLTERVKTPVWAIALLAFLSQILVLSRLAASRHLVPRSDDMKFYFDWAKRISAGEWTEYKAFYGLPGYAYWLASLLLVTAGDFVATCLAAGFLQTVAFAGVTALVFLFTESSIRSQVCAKGNAASEQKQKVVIASLAAVSWIAFAPAQAFTAVLMPTMLLVLAYWYGVRLLSLTAVSTPIRFWLFLGILIGGMSLFIATIFFLIPLAAYAIVRICLASGGARGPRYGLLAALLLSTGTMLGCSPAWVHNYFVARDPVLLSAHSGINMWIGNNPVANGYPKIPQGLRSSQEGLLRDSLLIPQQEVGHTLPRSEISKYWSEKAKSWISDHKVDWLRLVGTKLENFWNAFQYDDINVLQLLRVERVVIGLFSFGIISALALTSLPFVVVRLPYARWVVAGVLLHMCALIPVFVTERYRLAAVPGLLVCAALGLWILWRAMTKSEWRTVGTYLLLLGGSTLFVSKAKGDAGSWALRPYNLGIRTLPIAETAARSGNIDLAHVKFDRVQRALETAYRYSPGSTEINLALGNFWMAQNDTARAKLFYSRILALNPEHQSALNNLGVLALNAERWELAEKLFIRTVKADPTAGKAYYLLARARLGGGDVEGAHEAIGVAIELQPQQRVYLELRQRIQAAL